MDARYSQSALMHGDDKLSGLLAAIPSDIRGRNDDCNFSCPDEEHPLIEVVQRDVGINQG